MKKQDLIRLVILSGLILIAYIPTITWIYQRASTRDTYYSHAFLIPLISIFLVWLKRHKLGTIEIKPAGFGWVLFLSGLLIHILSTAFRVSFVSGLSIIMVLIGLVLLSFGKNYLRQLMFPIVFLIFMVPLPMVAIANLSFRLKIFAAQISTFAINRLGVPAIREGSVIKTMHAYIMVEDPCSGIRSLVALIALGALMAYFSNISKVRKGVLFLTSIPIAISTNVIRIISLVMVGEIYGQQYASGVFHDAMGILVFVFAFAGLALVGKILE